MTKQELKAIFSGKVQGVFFRAHLKKFADDLGLKGYAKNLSDGSVELRAVGEKRDLDKLVENIKKSPGFGRIDNVIIEFSSRCSNYSEFTSL